MSKRLMVVALAASLVGACGGSEAPPPNPDPQPGAGQRPFEWLATEPECSGPLRRGEWLLCDNPDLRRLHRALAEHWAMMRDTAGPDRVRMARQQQRAMISERNLCEDAACVAAAYKRYLPPAAQPTPRPTTAPPPPRKPIKRPVSQHPQRPPASNWHRPPGVQSCAAELGGSASAYLVRQCRVVNGPRSQCTADRTCADIRSQIRQGCEEGGPVPGFCSRL